MAFEYVRHEEVSAVEDAGDMSVGSVRPKVPNVLEAIKPLSAPELESALESLEDEANILAGKVMWRV